MSTTTIVEKTTEDDRLKSMRSFIIESEGPGSAAMPARRQFIAISVIQSEDISLHGEAPYFEPLPGEVTRNTALASALLTFAQQLIDRRINRLTDAVST